MTIATCPQCGNYFDQFAEWQRVCKTCYGANKRRASASPTTYSVPGAGAAERRAAAAEAAASYWQQRALNAERLAQARQSVQTRSAIPSDMLRRLLMLCHPDKHDGSAASTAATQWLLEQRN